jgi:hypothetical protein
MKFANAFEVAAAQFAAPLARVASGCALRFRWFPWPH